MNHFLPQDRPPGETPVVELKRRLREAISHFAAGTYCERRSLDSVSFHEPERDGDALEQMDPTPCDRVEHRLHVGRRAADHPQDLRCCRLLLERFGELPVARLQLLEQPRVLDRDHCLVGERLQERDFLFGELAPVPRPTNIDPMPRPSHSIGAMTIDRLPILVSSRIKSGTFAASVSG